MKMLLQWKWHADGAPLDEGMLPLLRAVRKTGSLKGALARVSMSYRHAWNIVTRAERDLGEPVVTLERGRGARLTPLGTRLIECDDMLTPLLKDAEMRVARHLADTTPTPLAPVTIWASHDMALARLRDALAADTAVRLDIEFHGSLECLAGMAQRRCRIAGFHVPRGPLADIQLKQYGAPLRASTLRLVHIADRCQGIMTAAGNPLAIHDISDLACKGVRFVNRQRTAGTRLLFDQLLGPAGVQPRDIDGYTHEEHTHAAVAATVASGHADAAFGVEAAAREYGLAFIPVAEERYFLGALANTWSRAAAALLLDVLRGPQFRAIVASLPGYKPAENMELQTTQQAFADN